MREIIFKRAEKRELSENAWDSLEMRETWQVCVGRRHKKPNVLNTARRRRTGISERQLDH